MRARRAVVDVCSGHTCCRELADGSLKGAKNSVVPSAAAPNLPESLVIRTRLGPEIICARRQVNLRHLISSLYLLVGP